MRRLSVAASGGEEEPCRVKRVMAGITAWGDVDPTVEGLRGRLALADEGSLKFAIAGGGFRGPTLVAGRAMFLRVESFSFSS